MAETVLHTKKKQFKKGSSVYIFLFFVEIEVEESESISMSMWVFSGI